MIKLFNKLCLGNKYVTTLHVINSAVVKLGKLTHVGKVYRGISRGKLPREFWKPNKFKVRGGIEYAFMSCTRDPEVSKSYATAQPAYGPVT